MLGETEGKTFPRRLKVLEMIFIHSFQISTHRIIKNINNRNTLWAFDNKRFQRPKNTLMRHTSWVN